MASQDHLGAFVKARTSPQDPLTQHLDRLATGGLKPRPHRRRWGTRGRWDEVLTMLKTSGRIRGIQKKPFGVEAQVTINHRHAAQTLLANRETVAGIFRVARIDAKPHPTQAHKATLTLHKRDLLVEHATTWPGVNLQPPSSLWDPIDFGWDEYGQPVRLSVMGRHMGIFGETGSGKSVAQSMIAATAALSNARIYLMDANEIQLSRWKAIAEEFVVDDMKQATNVLSRLLREVARRNSQITEAGLDKVSQDAQPLLLMIDEGADFLRDREFLPLLTRLCARGRAAGLCVVFATQSPNATIVPTPLRNNLGLRAVFRVADKSASQVALGSSAVDASTIAPEHRGVCYLHQDGVLPSRMRTFYPTPEQVRELCARAVAYRNTLKEEDS